MRLDKFLKVSRIIKRRTASKEFTQGERALVNGRVAKPSTKVKAGDILELTFGNKIIQIKINQILNSTKKEDSETMYEILSETKIEREI